MTDDSETQTWLAGPEHDADLRERLAEALESLGYRVAGSDWAVAGSQEVAAWAAEGPRGALAIEAETYIGITVTGPPGLVAELKRTCEALPERPR
ncbi:MAG: hypothetical protein AB7Q97_25540 [Gammaproteobacteria bacterium]